MSKEIKPIVSQSAVAYAEANITPKVLELNKFKSKVKSLAKIISYHVLEMCILAKGEKISHPQIEKTIGLEFDKRISSMGRKVADYINNEKPHRGQILTIEQFRDTKNDDGTVTPAELHVSTVAGQIGHDNAALATERKNAKSSVEQALQAIGMPKESAANQLALAAKGNDAAISFVQKAIETYKPIKPSKDTPVSVTPHEALELALEALIYMATEGGELAEARTWLTNACELIGMESESESESETLAA